MTILFCFVRFRTLRAIAIGMALSLAPSVSLMSAPAMRRELESEQGKAMAVVVGDTALLHTAGFLALAKEGQLIGRESIALQTGQVLANIENALHAGGSSFDYLVKLNLAVRDPALSAEVEKVVARRFAGKPKPALTLIVSNQPMDGALVSGDAVAMVASTETEVRRVRSATLHGSPGQSHAAVLPAGPKIYFSGKGGRGPTAETARLLLADLKNGMEYMGVRPAEIAQVRVFLKQMTETRQVEVAAQEFFGAAGCPPITYIEREGGKGAMEIEMIAAGRPADAKRPAQVEYFTPPKWKPSPQFSQVARVNRGGLIYVSGLRGNPTDDAESQAKAIFSQMEEVVRAGGGDFQHLAKALYYITGKEGGEGMDKVRPKVFDANRPPAASRNNLRYVGGAGGTMLVDMIGVVVEK